MAKGTTDRGLVRRPRLTAVVLALVASLGFAQLALAEEIRPYGPDLSQMYTYGYTRVNAIGATEWLAYSYAYDGYVGDNGTIIARGFNNGGYWHKTDERVCYLTGPGSCRPVDLTFDAGPSSNGQFPGSGSSARYATTRHHISWNGGSDYFYTSSDGYHSNSSCFNLHLAGC